MKTSLRNLAISLTLVTSSFIALTPTHAATPSYYNDCGLAGVVKPQSITQFCGDGGAGVSDIKWSSWGSTSAKGTGTYYINGCDPDCADGKISYSKVNVLLSGLAKTHGKNYLMKVTVTPLAGKKFVWPPSMKPVPTQVTWVTDYWQG
jgi:hypothetical protein